jgi:hypothetical protein
MVHFCTELLNNYVRYVFLCRPTVWTKIDCNEIFHLTGIFLRRVTLTLLLKVVLGTRGITQRIPKV